MSSPSDSSEEPSIRPKQDSARIAGIGVLVAVGASIFYWGFSQSRHGDAVPPNVPAVAAPSLEARVTGLEEVVKLAPTAENYLNLSLAYANARRFQDQIAAAQQAIRLKPDLAEAYNNLAAGYEDLRMWSEAIAAAQQAIRLKPDFQLARNNLAWALAQQAKGK
jgi:tetratricopeptide (TPR) repeat protein